MRRVVPQTTVQPVGQHAVVGAGAVLLGEPVVEAIDIRVLLQFCHEVAQESSLTGRRDRPRGGEIIFRAGFGVGLMLVVVARLHNLHLLAGEAGGQHIQRLREHIQRVVPEGVVREADDVVIHSRHLVVELLQDARLAGALAMNHDLGIGAHLAAGTRRLVQEIHEARPVTLSRGGVAAVGGR